MKTVYMVAGTTRIILPESQWSKDVLAWWAEHGVSAVATDQGPESCERDSAEVTHAGHFLNMTGV